MIPLLALLSTAAGRPAVECNLGGELVDGKCECYPTYTGEWCAQLALLSANTSLALYREGAASWGGSVVQERGEYHMYFANMLGGCGLKSWECNSAVGHAVAATPEGPYSVIEESIVPPFGHNPTVKAHNGSWYIYHIGSGETYKPFMNNCTGGFTPKGQVCGGSSLVDAAPPPAAKGDVILPDVLYSTNGSAGPWKSQKGSSPHGPQWAMNNPTVYIHPNGSALGIFKVPCNASVVPDPHTFCSQFVVATAQHPLGPYTVSGTTELYGEDAHLWFCPHSQTYRILFQGGAYTPVLPQWHGHFHMGFSVDGLSDWTIAGHLSPNFNDTEAFSLTVPLLNGSSVEYARRERHQLLLDPTTGEPAYLFQGGLADRFQPFKGSDHSNTLVQPVRTSRSTRWGQ